MRAGWTVLALRIAGVAKSPVACHGVPGHETHGHEAVAALLEARSATKRFRSVSKPMFRSDKNLDVCWGHRADVDAADPLARTALMVAAGAALPEAVRCAQRCPNNSIALSAETKRLLGAV